jgi:hypothetical protein
MYLCKFNFLLNEIKSETTNTKTINIFLLWLSMIMQIFQLDYPLEVYNNN